MKNSRCARDEWRRVLVRLPWMLLIPLGLLIPRLSAGHSAEIERIYSTGLYVPVKHAIAFVTSAFPFSAAEFLLYAVVATALVCLLVDLICVLIGRAPLAVLVRRVVSLGITFGALLILFYATWGLNYFRTPLKERMGLHVCERSVDELERLTGELAERANALRMSLPEDANGVATLENGYRAVFDALPEAYYRLSEQEPVFSGSVTRAKTVTWSKGLSWCGITGIYIGITAEPNVNVDTPAFLLPHTAAHEMAHQLGIASEDEAEFAGYLACLNSNDPSVIYAGIVSMLIDCGNALYAQNEAKYSGIYSSYCNGLKRDLQFQREYWMQYEGKAEEIATKTNDAYLKHNSQPSGVKSYGKVVDMLLAYRELTDF